jgi:hypothetical protein
MERGSDRTMKRRRWSDGDKGKVVLEGFAKNVLKFIKVMG